jgi:hypothetical protein
VTSALLEETNECCVAFSRLRELQQLMAIVGI